MDSGWVAAFSSFITALIVAGTAIAAFRQLRHGRNANDIVVYLRLVDFMDSETGTVARRDLQLVSEKTKEPEYCELLKNPTFLPDEMKDLVVMLRFLEHIAVLITKGGIAEGLVLAEYADNFVAANNGPVSGAIGTGPP
jgi:hypothetical protein